MKTVQAHKCAACKKLIEVDAEDTLYFLTVTDDELVISKKIKTSSETVLCNSCMSTVGVREGDFVSIIKKWKGEE